MQTIDTAPNFAIGDPVRFHDDYSWRSGRVVQLTQLQAIVEASDGTRHHVPRPRIKKVVQRNQGNRSVQRAGRYSIKHGYTFENSVLDAEYTMRIRFSWEPGSPATRDEPETPSHPYDLEVQWVDVEIDGCRMTLGSGSVKYFNGLLNSDPKFREEVEAACIEHVCDSAAAAYESHLEAQQQARRDND